MSRKRYTVEVRQGDGTHVETIKRVLRREAIGNYAHMFCAYRGKGRCLVESDALHLDDTLRCVEGDHVDQLFILPRQSDGRVVPTWDHVFGLVKTSGCASCHYTGIVSTGDKCPLCKGGEQRAEG